ncbi:MAG: flagellar basal body-associated FliL family protein [Candidatus Paracaedibacteraceae bacterium]|jgi:flagellar FliL protein|nr:flagellar basal body-associated FliL family protein [Candidatus Paracaedibacteraceae bacterium]
MSEENENLTPKIPTEAKDSGTGKIIIIGVFVLLIVIVAGIFFTPLGTSLLGHGNKEAGNQSEQAIKEPQPETPADTKINIETVKFIDIPEILLNLRNASGKSSFLKISITVQAPNEEVGKVVEKLKPLLIDQFQEYLRGLDVEDLAGSAGIERVRSELLTRTNNVISPAKASNVLIPSMLIQ